MSNHRISRAVLCLAILAGCGGKDVVAVVGKAKVRRADVEQFSAARSRTAAKASPEALTALIDRALLAEGARRKSLEDDPAIRARIRAAEREILAEAYLDKELRSATEDAAIRKRFEDTKGSLKRRQIHVAHIVLRVPSSADAEAKQVALSKATVLYSKLRDGADFAELAKSTSEDSVTGARGGDLEPIFEGTVDPSFFDAAVAVKKGEISKPFATPFGIHIVSALEDPQEVTPTFEEVRGKLAAEARLEAQRKLLEQLRTTVSVKTYPDRLHLGEKP